MNQSKIQQLTCHGAASIGVKNGEKKKNRLPSLKTLETKGSFGILALQQLSGRASKHLTGVNLQLQLFWKLIQIV